MTHAPYHISVFNDKRGNECYVVIDTLFRDISVGGIRVHEDVSLEETKDLAKAMSYKLVLFNIPMGGAKIGIRLKDGTEKEQALVNFGGSLSPFVRNHWIYPGKDLGTTEEDVALIYREILHQKHRSHSSYFTAVGLGACLDFISRKWNLENIQVALSGFGRVGYFLVKELIRRKINLVAISNKYGCIYKDSGLDKEALVVLKEKFNEDWIFHAGQDILPREELYALPVDVLIPGAEAYAINAKNSDGLRARFICPAANAPYEAGILGRLKEKGIVFFPDFITNAGGVLGGHFLSWGFSLQETEGKVIKRMREALEQLCRNPENNFYQHAMQLAQDRIQTRNAVEFSRRKRSLSQKQLMGFLKCYVPKFLLAHFYRSVVEKMSDVKIWF